MSSWWRYSGLCVDVPSIYLSQPETSLVRNHKETHKIPFLSREKEIPINFIYWAKSRDKGDPGDLVDFN